MLPIEYIDNWIQSSLHRVERMIIDGLADMAIERWIHEDKVDTAVRILQSLHEQVSILESAVIELSDFLELLTGILANESHILFDKYWLTILSNDYIHLKLNVAIKIQNVALWIYYFNPISEMALPEIRGFFNEYGQQLVRWGQGQFTPSDRSEELDEIKNHITELRCSVACLVRAKEFTEKKLRNKLRVRSNRLWLV